MPTKPTAQLRKITPSIAERMLKKNLHNRHLSDSIVDRYVKEMKEGKWIISNDAITFDQDGNLSNGQHRLTAVVKSGVTIDCFVLDGMPNEAFQIYDKGKLRKGSDMLSIIGEKNCTILAATLVWIEKYHTGTVEKGNFGFSNSDIVLLMDKYPAARDSVRIANLKQLKKLVAGSIVVCCHYLFSQKSEEQSKEFMDKLSTGSDLSRDSPIYVLRERLMANALSKQKYPPYYLMALLIKSWNLFRKQKTVKILTYKDDENFPIVE